MSETGSIYSYLQEESEDLYVHPNGFIQIILDEKTRVHFWHHRIPRQEVRTPIHDHIWKMYSCVLKGRIINIDHFVESGSNYSIHKPRGGNLRSIGKEVDVVDTSLSLVRSDEKYYVPESQFHESVAVEPSVTIIKKSDKKKERPRILVPKQKRPDNSFSRREAMSKNEIWNFVEKMIDYELEGNFQLLKEFNSKTFQDISED